MEQVPVGSVGSLPVPLRFLCTLNFNCAFPVIVPETVRSLGTIPLPFRSLGTIPEMVQSLGMVLMPLRYLS